MRDALYIETEGTAEFLLNMLIVAGVTVRKFTEHDRRCRFYIKGSEQEIFAAAMARHGREYRVLEDRSRRNFFKRNIGRIGLYIGLALVILAAVGYSTQVTRISLGGLSNVSEELIYAAVGEKVILPAKKNTLDCEAIERAIISVAGIASASVCVKGNVLLIEVSEELPKAEVIDKTDYTDIVSGYDGVVTRVIVYSGAAAVKQGDTVKKGQVLIGSEISLGDGLIAREKALGDIYGRVWETKQLIIYPTAIERRRTGRAETVVKFFRPAQGYEGKFGAYDADTESFYLFGAAPFKCYRTTYYEVEEVEVSVDFDGDAERIIKTATEGLEEELPADCKKIRTWYSIKRLDKFVQLDIYYEIEIRLNR